MSVRLEQEILRLKERVAYLGQIVEERVGMAIEALLKRDAIRAHKVIAGDDDIDSYEVELEEECLKILALHQPVAVDMRYIVAVLKINNDLERIGDLAVNIAERAESLSSLEVDDIASTPIKAMSAKVRSMLRESLYALVEVDRKSALNVFYTEESVDQLNRELFHASAEAMMNNHELVKPLLQYLSAAKNLERIADLSTNIAEDLLYLIDGDIARHRSKSKQ